MKLYIYTELLLGFVNYTSKFLFKIKKYSENFSKEQHPAGAGALPQGQPHQKSLSLLQLTIPRFPVCSLFGKGWEAPYRRN